MKTDVSTSLASHLAGVVLTVAWCWVLRRQDGFTVGFTTHVDDVVIPSKIPAVVGAVTCRATTGFLATDIAQTDSLSQNNLDVTAVLDDDSVTETDIRAGLWRNAQLEICLVNYHDLTMGTDTLFMGSIGNVTLNDISYTAEQRGLSQPLEANMDGIVSEQCDARLGDRRCGVDLAPFTRTGTVAAPTADRLFVDPSRTEADDWWTKGLLTMTSGASLGLTIEVKQSLATGMIELVDEFFYGIVAGDTYSITPGCNKLLIMADGTYTGDCKVKFANVRRFRGFRVPGAIQIAQYGGQDVAT